MSSFWIIAPFASSPSELFEEVWEYDVANNVISIGWAGFGNVLELSEAELIQRVASIYSHKPPQTRSLIANMLWAFYHLIRPGDTIIARRGRKTLAAVGRVTQSAVWSPGRNPLTDHAGYLGVEWQASPRDKGFNSIVFPMHSLIEVSREDVEKLLRSDETELSKPEPAVGTAGDVIEDATVFVLEKYLEDFIVSNFNAIFKGELTVYQDSEGNDGQQYTTDIGPIDILAVEPETKAFVVIELKKGRPSDQVVGQILRYMGWVKDKLCTDGQAVKGLVVCQSRDKKLDYALSIVSNIDIRYYSVSFSLRDNP
ncbi:endonuclease NucS domain-containing protein [Afipia sp. TerB]